MQREWRRSSRGNISFGIVMDRRGAIYPPAKAPPPFILQAWLVWGRESVWGGTSVHREAEARERLERA